MAKLRNSHGICPPEILKFLLDLFKYNDNSKNTFSDNYYRAGLVRLESNASLSVYWLFYSAFTRWTLWAKR